jgi:hypothetical protein
MSGYYRTFQCFSRGHIGPVSHTYPQKPRDEAKQEFGASKSESVAHQLGNLVLVEKSINASFGNRPYSQKRDVHRESQLLLTRALAERPKVGKNTAIDGAVATIEPYQTWNEVAVTHRQDKLVTLAQEVWNI